MNTAKMIDEALAMRKAVAGDTHGDYFHCFNWSDKPHRVVYDAAKIIKEAAQHIEKIEKKHSSVTDLLFKSSVLLGRETALSHKLVCALIDLKSLVEAECPRILDETRGGSAELDLRIETLLEEFILGEET